MVFFGYVYTLLLFDYYDDDDGDDDVEVFAIGNFSWFFDDLVSPPLTSCSRYYIKL